MISTSLARVDHWRREPADAGALASFKEWHHFLVMGDGIELLINFSLAGGTPRLIVMGRADDWFGSIEAVASDAVRFDRRGASLQLGNHRMDVHGDHYRVRVDDPCVKADLRFDPHTEPMVAHDHPVGGGRRLSWLICPLMSVRGTVAVRGRSLVLERVVGYHDHNWGVFDWGDDFVWEWAIVLPHDVNAGWAVVLSSLQNRQRSSATLEQVLLWHEGQNRLASSNEDVSIEARGHRSPRGAFTLPSVMKLVAPTGHGDVPEELRVRAVGKGRRLDLRLTVRDDARLVLPSERDMAGTVTIHECVVDAKLEVETGDGRMEGEGRGIVELVRH